MPSTYFSDFSGRDPSETALRSLPGSLSLRTIDNQFNLVSACITVIVQTQATHLFSRPIYLARQHVLPACRKTPCKNREAMPEERAAWVCPPDVNDMHLLARLCAKRSGVRRVACEGRRACRSSLKRYIGKGSDNRGYSYIQAAFVRGC